MSVKEIIDLQPSDGIKFATATVHYQSKDELKRNMYSFVEDYPTVDVMLLIDGAFDFLINKKSRILAGIETEEQFPESSNDGTKEMIETFKQEQAERGSRGIKVYSETFIGNEFEKRQRYLELCAIFKINAMMIIDSDEFVFEDPRILVKKDWNAFRAYVKECLFLQHNVFSIDIVHTEYGGRDPHKRIWLYPDQMSYWGGSHYKFINPQDHDFERLELSKHLGRQPSFLTFKQITLKHDHNLRTDAQFHFRQYYQSWLVNYEHLLESQFTLHDAKHLALVRMKEIGYTPVCTCRRCTEKHQYDPRWYYDQRPKNMRKDWDPFGDIKEKANKDPEFAKTLKRTV